jgi:hypothetical protein
MLEEIIQWYEFLSISTDSTLSLLGQHDGSIMIIDPQFVFHSSSASKQIGTTNRWISWSPLEPELCLRSKLKVKRNDMADLQPRFEQ